MKKLVLVFVIFLLIVHVSTTQENPQYRYKIDLKTKFKNKQDLKPLKHGLKALLERSRYFENKEFGEDYSLWINSPQVNRSIDENGNKRIVYSCILELRTPAAFGKGDFIDSREIFIDYTIDKEELSKLSDPKNMNIGKFVADLGCKITDPKQRGVFMNLVSGAIATSSGATSLAVEAGINQTCKAFSNYFAGGEALDYKAEYYIVGGELYNKLVEMIISLENQ